MKTDNKLRTIFNRFTCGRQLPLYFKELICLATIACIGCSKVISKTKNNKIPNTNNYKCWMCFFYEFYQKGQERIVNQNKRSGFRKIRKD